MIEHRNYRLYIHGDHPHQGEICYPLGETEETMSSMVMDGITRWLVKSEETGIEFYITKKDASLLPPLRG